MVVTRLLHRKRGTMTADLAIVMVFSVRCRDVIKED